MKNIYHFREENYWETKFCIFRYLNRRAFALPSLSEVEQAALDSLKVNGFAMINNFISSNTLDEMHSIFERDLQSGHFEMPTLAQSKIDPQKHRSLIKNYLFGNGAYFKSQGIAFDRDEFHSLDQCIKDFSPSTLKSYFNPTTPLFFNVILSDFIRNIVESYFHGIRPELVEAYSRRSFPASYPVMNHFWHRDSNHKTFLLKAFLFLTDCDDNNGPHYYIKGTHKDFRLNGCRYYSEEQVRAVYCSEKDIVCSKVKAGTLLLEDTRGLHRAGIPREGLRDLVYGVFFPRILPRWRASCYSINRDVYNGLDSKKRAYISKSCIL